MLRKAAILFPITALMLVFSYGYFEGFLKLGFFLNTAPFIVFITVDIIRRKKESSLLDLVQSSYYVYLFSVLALTIYFFPYLPILEAVKRGEFVFARDFSHFNLIPFRKYLDYSVTHHQVYGNLIMLFPLGIFLPILYKKVTSLVQVFWIAVLFSLGIEITQFVLSIISASVWYSSVWGTTYGRAMDIDDLILNTLGAVLGFLAYQVFLRIKPKLIKTA